MYNCIWKYFQQFHLWKQKRTFSHSFMIWVPLLKGAQSNCFRFFFQIFSVRFCYQKEVHNFLIIPGEFNIRKYTVWKILMKICVSTLVKNSISFDLQLVTGSLHYENNKMFKFVHLSPKINLSELKVIDQLV